jgi:3-(3-hydroxy-phenyl)propionate hydroxylase
MTPERIVIAGAGPVGVIAAILLARRGLPSLIVERHAEPYGLPRAVHIDDEVFRALQDVGIAEEFDAISRPFPGMRLLDASYRTMAEFERSIEPGINGYPQANFFDQPDLEKILRDSLSTYPLIELRTSTELVSLEHSDDHVRVLVRNLATGKAEWITAPVLLGCDGANSAVRELIGSTVESMGYEERWCVVDALCEEQLPVWPGMYQVCDPTRATTFGQIGQHRYRWEFHLGENEQSGDILEESTLRSLVDPVLGDVDFASLDFIRSAEYTFRAQVADRWRSGRVFLLGDAAHLTPPFVGQGLCAGIRDAINLAWKLDFVLERGASEELLETYQAERKPHAKKFIRLAMLVGWAMTGGQDRAAAVRKGALAVATRIPGFSTMVVNQASPPVTGTPLVRRPRVGRSVSGALMPQPWVAHEGRRMRFDDVLGGDFAVVVRGAPAWEELYLAERLGARVVSIVPAGSNTVLHDATVAEDVDGVLIPWLAQRGLEIVIVRPDRIVLDAMSRRDFRRSGSEQNAQWLTLVEPRRMATT